MAVPTAITDKETRLVEDDHHSVKLWLRLLTCTNMIEKRLRDALREEFDTTLPRFDFLAQLERSKDGLTMGELSSRMMVSGGNVTGLATQLANEGYVKRNPMPNNRRSFIVKLTPKGRRYFARLAQRHEEWLIEMLGNLQESEVDVLMRLLRRIKSEVAAAD